jgi:hypothetical protein
VLLLNLLMIGLVMWPSFQQQVKPALSKGRRRSFRLRIAPGLDVISLYRMGYRFGSRPAKSSRVSSLDFGSRSKENPISHPVTGSPITFVPGIFKTLCFKSSP